MNRITFARAARALLAPLVVALPPLFWIVDGTQKASFSALGRDQGIFQYIAWAVAHGAKDYRDVRDVNGPLTHFVHLVFYWLGGAEEHRFRVLDFWASGIAFAIVGACLPGFARKGRVRVSERLAWALAGWVVLSGQYLLFLFWDLAQRESFFDWFMLTGVALQLAAQRSLASPLRLRRRAGGEVLLALAAALGTIPCFGKPTYVLFTIAQLVALLIDRDFVMSRKRRLALFTAGVLAGAATQVFYLVAYADIGAYLRITLHDVPAMYRFIWPRTLSEIVSMPGHGLTIGLALATSLLTLSFIGEGLMPRRAFAVALVPVVGLANVAVQSKGFPYHFHPVTSGLSLVWLLIVVWLAERGRTVPRKLAMSRLVPLLAAVILALRVVMTMSTSPHVQALYVIDKGLTHEEREENDYLVYYKTSDFFPYEMRQTAAYLREHTKPTDRVQTYGMDPYVLFLAQRMSATPYVYAYDLNADAALSGGMLRNGLHPTEAQQEEIRAIRDAHEDDLLARLERDPPAAFVFFDKSPLITWQDAWEDFQLHSPRSATWVASHYEQTAVFGEDRVWMRKDLAEGVAKQ